MRTEPFPTALRAVLMESVARKVVLVLQAESRCCMNRSHFAVVAAIVASSYLIADEKKPERLEPITAASLNQRDVIGKIGVPLGHGATIEATVIDGETLDLKRYDDRYLLRVVKVNGKNLETPQSIEFLVDLRANTELVAGPFELYERKYGRKPDGLSNVEIEALEEGYVNTPVRLVVYEAGYFRGIPKTMPAGIPRGVAADYAFQFVSHLMVVKQLPLDNFRQNSPRGK